MNDWMNVFSHGRSSELFFRQHEDWDWKELPGLSGLLCRPPVSGRPKLQTFGHQISSHLQFPHHRLWQRSKGGKIKAYFPGTFAPKLLQSVIFFFSSTNQTDWKWQGGVLQHSPSLRLKQRGDLAPVQPEAQRHLSNGAGLFVAHHVPRPSPRKQQHRRNRPIQHQHAVLHIQQLLLPGELCQVNG